MSNAAKSRKPMSEYTRLKISKKSMGRRHSDFSIEKIRASKIGKKRSKEVIEKMRASAYKGKDSRFWKGGIRKNKISLYDTYAHRIDFAEEVSYKLNEGGLKILLVKCSYCGKWFNPSTVIVQHRISSLEGRSQGEKRLYCSESCKKACPIYNQTLYPKGFKPATSREVQPELRQLVLERDDWTCQYGNCGKTTDNAELHCHHITGIKQNPIESADVDNCITLCKKHHKKVHSQAGCKYFDLRCS
jgi:5-methylcytosine-specific restriction endonuclease McrA